MKIIFTLLQRRSASPRKGRHLLYSNLLIPILLLLGSLFSSDNSSSTTQQSTAANAIEQMALPPVGCTDGQTIFSLVNQKTDFLTYCDGTVNDLRQYSSRPSSACSRYTELTNDQGYCISTIPDCAFGINNITVTATIMGTYTVNNSAGASTTEIDITQSGFVEIYRRNGSSPISFTPLCRVTPPNVTVTVEADPGETITGTFNPMQSSCTASPVDPSIFQNICNGQPVCFDALADADFTFRLFNGNGTADVLTTANVDACIQWKIVSLDGAATVLQQDCPGGTAEGSVQVKLKTNETIPSFTGLEVCLRKAGMPEVCQPAGSTLTFNNLVGGTYDIFVRSTTGCIRECKVGSVTVGTFVEPTFDVSINGSCFDEPNTGTITLSQTGGETILTYDWTGTPTGDGTNTISNLAGGSSYSVTVTYGTGCSKVFGPFTAPAYPEINATVVGTNIVCNGDDDGAIAVTPTTGDQPFTISISGPTSKPNQTANLNQLINFTGLEPGVYTVTVADKYECDKTYTVTITEPPALVCGTISTTNAACAGIATGSINAGTPTGGTGPYEFSLSGPTPRSFQSSPVFSSLLPGSYTVTVKDDKGCTTTCTATVGEDRVLVCPNIIAPTAVCEGSTGVLFTADGDYDTYSWSIISGATNGVVNPSNQKEYVVNAFGTDKIIVQLIASYNDGCSKTCTKEVDIIPTPTVNDPTDQVRCAGTLTAAVNFTGSGTVYNWTNNNTAIGLAASGTGNIGAFTALNSTNAPITATIEVTPTVTSAGITCIGAPQSFTITVNPTPTVTDPADQVLCAGFPTAGITFSGTVPGTVYNWTATNATAIGLPAANGTGNIASFTAVNNTASTIVSNITVTPTYTNAGVTCNGSSQTFTITVNPLPPCDITGPAQFCASTSATFTGPNDGILYTYNWSILSGSSSAAIAGASNQQSVTLNATSITGAVKLQLVVTNIITGCSKTCTLDITVGTNPMTCIITNNPTVCKGETITFSIPSGGYNTYTWSVVDNLGNGLAFSGANTNAIVVTIPSVTTATSVNVSLVASRADGCRTECIATALIKGIPSVVPEAESPICNNGGTGSIKATASGGEGPYTFRLYNYINNVRTLLTTYTGAVNETVHIFTGLSAGDYDVEITDVNGCSFDPKVTITITPALSFTAVPNCAASTTTDIPVQLTISNAQGTPQYSVDGGGTGTYVNVPANGIITVPNDQQPHIIYLKDSRGACSAISQTVSPVCFVCPTITTVTVGTPCEGREFTVTATGLVNMSATNNLVQDFGIQFVYFAAPTATPYTGGTSLGTVAFGSLTSGGTVATLSGLTLPTAGTYYVYAILSPAPADANCRPSATAPLTVVENPTTFLSFEDESDAQTICVGGTASLLYSVDVPTGYGCTWTLSGQGVNVTGTSDVLDGTVAISGVSGLAPGTYTYTLSVDCTTGGCDVPNETITLTIVADPTTTLNFTGTGATQTICVGGTAGISYSVDLPDGFGCGWTLTGQGVNLNGSGDVASTTAAIAGVSDLAPGTYTYTLSATCTSGGCNVADKTITLTVVADPTTTLSMTGGVSTICVGGTSSLTYSVDLPDGFGCGWTLTGQGVNLNGSGDVASTTAAIAGVSDLAPGTYTYTLSATCTSGGCNVADKTITLTVVADPTTTLSMTGGVSTICVGGTASLTYNVDLPDGFGCGWTLTGQGVNLSGSGDVASTTATIAGVSDLAPGTYTYTLSATCTSGGCNVADKTITLTVVPDATTTLSMTGGVSTICVGGTTSLTYSVDLPDGFGCGWTLTGQGVNLNGSGDVASTTATIAGVSDLAPGTYTYTLSATCTSGGCNVADKTITLTVVADPTTTFTFDGGSTTKTICVGEREVLVSYSGDGLDESGCSWTLKDEDGNTLDSGSGDFDKDEDIATSDLEPGEYTFTLAVVNCTIGGCGTTDKTITLRVLADPTTSLFFDNESNVKTVCEGENVDISYSMTATEESGCGWTLTDKDGNIIDSGSGSFSKTEDLNSGGFAPGIYTYTLTVSCSTGGCGVDPKTITLTVLPDPVLTISLTESKICVGGTTNLTYAISGDARAGCTYDLTFSGPSGAGIIRDNQPVPVTSTVLDVATILTAVGMPAGTYTFTLTVDCGTEGCGAEPQAVTLTVLPDPVVTIALTPEEPSRICFGGSTQMTSSVTFESGQPAIPCTIYFQKFNTTTNTWDDVSTSTNVSTATYNTPTDLPVGTHRYRTRVVCGTGLGCEDISDTEVTITIVADPSIVLLIDNIDTNNAEVCETERLDITTQISGGTDPSCLSIQWQFVPSDAVANAAFTSAVLPYASAKDLVINSDLFASGTVNGGKLYVELGPDPGWKITAVLSCSGRGCDEATDLATVKVNRLISAIIAEDETYTLPSCAETAAVCYSFNIISECDFAEFDPTKLVVDFGDLQDNLIPNSLRYEDTGIEGIFVEYCFNISPTDAKVYNIKIDYVDPTIAPVEDVTVRIQILANQGVTNYRNLSCTENINIKLDEECQATLKASQVLNGAVVCDNDFCIEIVQTVNNRIVYTNRNGVIDNGCGQYIYRVYRKRANGECDFSNMTCWGYVNAEDKTAPSIECPDNAQRGRRELPVYTFAGTLGAGDDIFDPTESTCFRSTAFGGFAVLDLLGTDRFYDLQNFKVTTSGIYTLHLISRDQNPFTGNGLAALYGTGGFDEDYPCENILALGDYTFAPGPWSGLGDYLNFLGNINGWSIFLSAIYGGQGDTDPYIRTYLTAGREYTLLTSSTLGLPDGGDYRWFIYPEDESGKVTTFNGTVFELFDGNGRLINPLICTDKDLLVLPTQKCYYTDEDGNLITASGAPLSEAAFEATPLGEVLARTGYPHVGDIFGGSVSDNCGDITICVSDRLVERNGDCGEWVIIRTFTATDECSGLRDFCEQRIRVRQPTLEDVVLPHYTQYVDCAEDYLTVAGTDRPSPEVTGYPFVITAFGYYDLGVDGAQTYCKLGATYEDKARVDICDQSFKFIREWTIYDWCNPGRTIIYNQLIKVGDFKGPEVGDLPQDPWDCLPTFSTGTYACESSFIIPTPDGLSDNCSDSITFSVDIIAFVPEYDVHGFLTGEYEQTNFRSGLRAGQLVTGVPKGLHLFKYTIGDECHNKTIVYFWFQVIDNSEPVAQCDDFLNVSIGAQTIDGSTRIYAKDVDEGSYDGCAEKVALATRRTFDDTACADQYSQLFFEVAFGSLVKRTNFDLYAFNPTLYGYYHVPVTVYFDTAPEGNPNALAVFTEETNPRGVTELFSILNDYVDILCCDIKDSVRIELWVWDDANMNGIPGDYDFLYGDDELFDFLQDRFCPTGEAEDRFPDIDCLPTCGQIWDNHNVCWLDVLIEDKAKPICKPPANITIPCTDTRVRYEDAFVCADSTLLNDFFGSFIGVDNCEVTVECIGVTDTRNNCGIGTITRNYRAVDGWGNASAICRQTITIFEEHNYVIGFPADTSGLCAQVKDTAIYIQENACDLLAIAVKDLRFEASGDECYKIERKFSVINWCEYDGISDPYVISRDVDGDGIGGDEDIWVIRRPSRTYLDRAGTAARNYIQNLPNINDASNAAGLLVAIETDRIPALNAEDTRTPFTDEFPDAPWGGNSPEGSWDWADAPVDLNKNGRIDTEIERGLGGTNDDASRGGTGANKLDKLYAYKQSVGFGNLTNFTTGYWQYTQFIKVYDNVDPTVTFDVDPFCSYSSDIAKGCPAPADIPFTVFEACTPNDIKIKVFLDAFDNGTIDADNLLPANTLKVKFGASVTGTYPNFVITGGLFPLGEHVFEVHILDGCGNSTVARIPFEVIDCKAPSPICINGLAVELMPVIPNADVDGDGDTDTGAMAIWANDFADVDKIIDCTGPVKLAIYRSDDEALTDSTFIPDPADIGITVTCGDFDSAPGNPNGAGGTVLVRVYAIDGAGNFDYCETYVLVQNNLNTACVGSVNPGTIAGTIATEDNKAVQGVSVQLSGQASSNGNSTLQGAYGFANLETGYDYTVTPSLDKNPLNGVSTFDLILITKHILGVQLLDSPYKMIAADVNSSKSISTLDLIQLRKLILSIDLDFANNTSWRFVDKKYVFPVPSNPWAEEFPEIINVNDLAGAISDADFTAVKIGDVNQSVVANSLTASEVRGGRALFEFQVQEATLQTGEEYRIEFKADDIATIQGYQATLTFEATAVEVMDIVYGTAKAEHFGMTHLQEGVITTSWNQPSEAISNEEVLFTLVIKAKADVTLSEVLGISSRYTVAEAYATDNAVKDIAIQFSNGTVVGAGFELYQNTPNPFKASTEIRFSLPTASDASVTISDMTGKVIKLVRGSYAKGANKIDLNANDLPTGVLTYTLQSGDFTATKKMVVVK